MMFMTRFLSNLINNLTEEIHEIKIKCKDWNCFI